MQDLTVAWLFINGVLVFFMQCGFGMLETGAVRRKNIKNILIKNMTDVCAAAISFWLFGFGFAYGGDGKFIGDEDYFGGKCLEDKYHSSKSCGAGFVDWFFQFAFAATTATIVSGCVAERTQFLCYVAYSTLLTGFVYPVIAHWVWGGGWLAEEGVSDFAGSGVVHMTGGLAGLIGAAVIGPRIGRFEGDRFNVVVNEIQSSSIVFVGLGVFILWTGWYGFNTGSTLGITGNEEVAELVIMNTTLAPAAAGLVCLIVPTLINLKKGKSEIPAEPMLNGILAGLVSITAGCASIDPGLAFFTGIVGGFVYLGSSQLLKQLKIDDPLDAAPVHFFCGMWGVLANGLFCKEKYATSAGYGWWMGGDGTLFGWQLVMVLAITAWVTAFSLLIFVPLKLLGLARVSAEVEEMGLDEHHHGGKDKHESVTMEVFQRVSQSNLKATATVTDAALSLPVATGCET